MTTQRRRVNKGAGQSNIPFVWEQGPWPIFPNGDNSALRGLGMLLGSLGEVLGGCANAIATTKSWERAPARLKPGCESKVRYGSNLQQPPEGLFLLPLLKGASATYCCGRRVLLARTDSFKS